MKTYPVRFAVLLFQILTGTLVWAQQRSDNLFLSHDDIPRVLRIAPGLAEATNKGPEATRAYLASQELSYRKFHQVVTNIAVAYTAIKLEEYIKQVEPLLDQKNKDSQYQKYIEQARKQLAELTEKFEKVRKNGRSALDVNKEYVLKNLPAVEELMVHVRNGDAESLPKE
jgi:hypothetical protein